MHDIGGLSDFSSYLRAFVALEKGESRRGDERSEGGEVSLLDITTHCGGADRSTFGFLAGDDAAFDVRLRQKLRHGFIVQVCDMAGGFRHSGG